MNFTKHYALIFVAATAFACTSALLLYAFNNQWIIIALPMKVRQKNPVQEGAITKKCIMWYWHRGAWQQEEVSLLWHEDLCIRIHTLIARWLSIVQEEQAWPECTPLQTLIAAPNGDHLYCSLERSPFSVHMAIKDKLLWIEGVLKTIRSNETKVRGIQLLVQHQPLIDAHLALNCWWPIEGFLNETT